MIIHLKMLCEKVKTSIEGLPQNHLYYKSVLSTRRIVGPTADREINLPVNQFDKSGEFILFDVENYLQFIAVFLR